jgi:hypothetical protein
MIRAIRKIAMDPEFTTEELVKITGLNRRTLETWVRKGWLPPLEAGGGRGKQNKFNKHRATWALSLHQAFQIWPDADTPLELYNRHNPKAKEAWSQCTLADGAKIIKYLETPPDPYFVNLDGLNLALVLLTGVILEKGTPTNKRFARMRIQPPYDILNVTMSAFYMPFPFTTVQGEDDHAIELVTILNITQLYKRVEYMVKRL